MTKNAVAPFSNHLPLPVSDYLDNLRRLGQAAAQGTGNPFLKMAKDGKWSYGAEGIAVSEADLWLVNPFSFRVGVIGWANGQKVGEDMYVLGTGMVDKSKLPEIVSRKQGDGWKDQLSVDLYSQADGVTVTFSTTSVGGTNAIGRLAAAIASHEDKSEVPVVKCVTQFYMHKEYGKTYTPDFEIVDWVKLDEPKERPNLI